MNYPTRILIADDHEIFRNGFRLLLKNQKEAELAGEAENGEELLQAVSQHLPHVVITDIKMPVLDGIEATRLIKEKHPQVKVIALSNYNEDSLIIDMLEAGADGYLLKNTNPQELLLAIKTVMEDHKYYCRATSTKLAKFIAESRFNPYKNLPPVKLTAREREIVVLICQEMSNKEIAAKLGLSIRTVESYRDHIVEKIGARNMAGIVLYAIKHKIYEV